MTTRPTKMAGLDRDVDALLAHSAPLARELAAQHCTTRNGRDRCDALHGVWPLLRRLSLAAEPDRHAVFYEDALRALAGTRVAIAGCADWGMLDTVASAYADRLATLDITVIDRCATPLRLCTWYGDQVGLDVRTLVADLTAETPVEDVDLICTHSLLTYPDLDGRRRLVTGWARALRPGGAVVTVSRLSTSAPKPVDDAAARTLGDLALQRCAAIGLEVDANDLRARVERYARAQLAHPVGTPDDLCRLFESAGFDVARLDVRELAGPVRAGEPIGGAARAGTYGEIVALRR
jgi:SAM-dependent methyltransferase